MMVYKSHAFIMALGLFQISVAMEQTPQVFRAQDTSYKHVAFNRKYYSAKSPAKLVEILLPINASYYQYVKEELVRQKMNEDHRQTFTEIDTLFKNFIKSFSRPAV